MAGRCTDHRKRAACLGLTAGFVSYQKAFDGGAETITAQPLLFYNLSDGYYLRSSGIASFDLVHQTSVVPVGLDSGASSRSRMAE